MIKKCILGEQNIEILFEARGAQIRELQRHIEELSVQKDNEIRHLKHKNTLLDAEAEKLKQHQVKKELKGPNYIVVL